MRNGGFVQGHQKRIAFVIYEYPLGVSSMVINSIRLFAANGYPVDIYINYRNLLKSSIDFPEENITFIVYDDRRRSIFLKLYRFVFFRTGNLFSPVTKHISIKRFLLIFYPHISRFSRWLTHRLNMIDYTYVMPVEYYSLLCLHDMKEKHKIVYYNMELMGWQPKNPTIQNKLVLKNLEYNQIQHLSHIVVPSPHRAEIFSQINKIDRNNIYVLPVAAMGKPADNKNRFFRDLFNIADNKRIVIYSGNFRAWAQCLEIIHTVRRWPRDFVLVMHTWNKQAFETSYFSKIKRAARELPVYFSGEYIEYDDLAEFLSSADIGLAFYEEIDENFTEILFSSNKIGEYLKAGLAVICSDFPSLNNFVRHNNVGMAVSPEYLPQALEQIGSNIDYYKNNALTCYQEQYSFEHYFRLFYDHLTSSTKKKQHHQQ